MVSLRAPAAIAFLSLGLTFAGFATGGADPLSSKPADFGTSDRFPLGIASFQRLQSTSAVIPNNKLCGAVNDQSPPVAVNDGGGGVIAAWSDYRGANRDIYVQKMNSAGASQWGADGVPACKHAGHQTSPQVAPDGSGGLIVVWEDDRAGLTNLNIYAQRMNAVGVAQWAAGGVLVCGAAGHQTRPAVTSNGMGGAIITWTDARGAETDIYAQRLNATGVALWTADGVAVCSATGIQDVPQVVQDGAIGAILMWSDERSGIVDLFAQRINENGTAQWLANGVAISSDTTRQRDPALIADGAGGAIVAWADTRGESVLDDIVAQRLSPSGALMWTAGGVNVCAAESLQTRPRLCSDGAGGAVFAWDDARVNYADVNIYAQRLNATGVAQWTANGVGVCTSPGNQVAPAIAANPLGGSFVAWNDLRNPANYYDIYAQRVMPNGTSFWTANGIQLTDALGAQFAPDVVADGGGGASVVWQDFRNGAYSDIYGQRADANGMLPDQCVPPDTLASDFHQSTVATQNYRKFTQEWFYWSAVGVRGSGGDWDIEVYDRDAFGLAPYPTCFGLPLAGSYGTKGVEFVVMDFNDNRTPPATYGARAYRYSGTGGAQIEWDDGPDEVVIGGTVSKPPGWAGLVDVFDIELIAGNTYTLELNHNPGDDIRVLMFASYLSPNFYYLAPRSAAVFETGGRYGLFQAPTTQFFGMVVVNDNGGTGGYTLKVWNGALTGVGDGDGTSLATGLRRIAPNPGRGPVTIQFALAEAAEASFRIYDMAGRQVAAIPARSWQSGAWSVTWDGRDEQGRNAAAGIYFVQMNVNGSRAGLGRFALLN